MLAVRVSDIPFYLRSGCLFQSFDSADEEAFEVPENCTKKDTAVRSISDLTTLLRSVRYWGLPGVPLDAIRFIVEQGYVDDYAHLLVEFSDLSDHIDRILKIKQTGKNDTVCTAIKLNFGVEVVQLLHMMEYPLTVAGCEAAATVGDLEILMYLHTEGCPWDERTTTAAVRHNHIDCIQYALDCRCPRSEALADMAGGASLALLKYLQQSGFACSTQTITAAILNDKDDNLRFLVQSGCPFPVDVCHFACIRGNLPNLTYLHRLGNELTIECSFFAAMHGHLPCLVYLHEHHCPWDELCTHVAAGGNHLECLQYLHENGCPWDQKTVIAAVGMHSWDCLWYALRHGCDCWVLVECAFWIIMILIYICCACTKVRDADDLDSYYVHDLAIIALFLSMLLPVLDRKFGPYCTKYVTAVARRKIMARQNAVSCLIWLYYIYLGWCDLYK